MSDNVSKMSVVKSGDEKLLITIHYIDDSDPDKFICEWYGQGENCPDFFVYGFKDREYPAGLIQMGLIKKIYVDPVLSKRTKAN